MNLNVKPKTIQLLGGKNVVENLWGLALGKGFLDLTLKV